jgi:hypothetical protein
MPQRLPGASTYVKSLGGALAEICWFLVELAASLLNLPDLMVESISWIMAALRAPAHKLKRAQIRLATDAGANDEEIAVSVGVGGSTLYRTLASLSVGQRNASKQTRDSSLRNLFAEPISVNEKPSQLD